MSRFIAFYLPQYYPTPENEKWYGKGFTEWTNVAKAKPLYRGHYEPHIPADLGFYDMRLKNTIISQAAMARKYGIEGFCYWHYWFGNGISFLAEPFQRLIEDKNIDIGFCLSWANDSWYASQWESHASGKKLMAEQIYPGAKDIDAHFYSLLEAFRDERYIRVNSKPVFCVHFPTNYRGIAQFIDRWRNLAKKEGLNDFFFIGKDHCCDNKKWILEQGFDAIYDVNCLRIHRMNKNIVEKAYLKIKREIFHRPSVYQYKAAIKYMITEEDKADDVFPVILPNWDHSPRTGGNSVIFDKCEPRYFKWLTEKAISANHQPEEKNIIFIQSWNEWGEGNHLEPDLKYGHGYLEALKEAVDEYKFKG